MKVFVLVLAALFALALSDDGQDKYKVADKTFLEKQKKVLQLFSHINQPSHHREHVEIAKTFTIGENVDHYKKPEVIKEFVRYLKYKNILHRGEVFSVFNIEHLEQAIALFKVLYHANDFETFYKTAVWARQHVNEGMFLYATSVAIVHRQDTQGIILPPIHEVYPHYFFNSEVIHEAYRHKQEHDQKNKHTGHEQGRYNGYTVIANYSGHYLNLHPEQSMSYYLEDVGINSFYYYYNLHYPFWMDGKEYGLEHDKRGELYYYLHQQILARYYMERISNDMGEIRHFNWETPIETSYYPSMEYPNGLEFPSRPHHARLQEYYNNYGQSWTTRGPSGYSYTFVRDYERRIHDAIDRRMVYTDDGKKMDLDNEDGDNILGNMIEGNYDSPDRRYYGSIQFFGRHLLGYSKQPLDKHRAAPSAMEHYETCMRDPMFYQMYKKIIGYFQRHKMHMHPYTKQDLEYPGVKVTKVDVDSLETYHDSFYSDISNAVYDTDEELQHDTFHVRAKQYRLNHKPFTYKIHVQSDKHTKASVKVFMAPKYDEYGRYINITRNRMNMVELDHFVHDLKAGENVITRNSYDADCYGPDRTTYDELTKQVEEAIQGQKEFHIDGKQNYFHFPRRYMLPKGSRSGTRFTFAVFVYPYKPYKGKDRHVNEYNYPKVGTGAIHVDDYPVGYPFDRFIKFNEMWHEIPNSGCKDVKVYHKHAEEINAPHH
ncbi:hexamerin-like [Anoplophora glabripennis]|uniref:hexamerin-like n=1 Tax=Anoplophora glabripennis TaxID=217634 RepID=UPI000875A455|nr:hexamerin-like [Anoplophora glabripennis]